MINVVDEFVFLDDVNYINKGWINRNRILVNSKEHMFTIPLKEASQNKLINEIEISRDGKWQKKILKTIEGSYKKAPFFDLVFPLIEKIILSEEQMISKYIFKSMVNINEYLNINTSLIESSVLNKDLSLKGQNRIIDICIRKKADEYINAVGGMEIYSKEIFSENNIMLHFIKSKKIKYAQFQTEFIPWLSIIDVLMFNSRDMIKEMLNGYEFI